MITDYESRHLNDSSDWMLNKQIFNSIQQRFGPFSMDLFASFRNTQLKVFFSWKPDPMATAVDTLAQEWRHHRPYLFPPFALVGRALQKIKEEKVPFALLVAPVWPAQLWHSLLLSMLINHPQILPNRRNLLSNPQNRIHPMVECNHMTLAAWPVSGMDWRVKDFRRLFPPHLLILEEVYL